MEIQEYILWHLNLQSSLWKPYTQACGQNLAKVIYSFEF